MPNDVQDPPAQTVDDILGPEPTIDDILGPPPEPGPVPETIAGLATKRPNSLRQFTRQAVIAGETVPPPARLFDPDSVGTFDLAAKQANAERVKSLHSLEKSEAPRINLKTTPGLLGVAAAVMPNFAPVQGLNKAVAQAESGFTTPAQLATLPFMGLKPVQAAFMLQMAASSPEVAKQTYDTLKSPDATPEEKWQAMGSAGIHAAMVVAPALHLTADEVRTRYTPEQAERLAQQAQTVDKPRATIPPDIAAAAKVLPRAAAEVAKIEPRINSIPIDTKLIDQPKEPNAPQERKVEGDVPAERVGNDEGRTPPGPSGGGSVPPAAGVETPPTGAQPETLRPSVEPLQGFTPPPQPEKFSTLQDLLDYREKYKQSEIAFYKSLGLSDSEAMKFFRAGDARSNTDVSAIEEKLSPESLERLDRFSKGEGGEVYTWDRMFDPNQIVGETDKGQLSQSVVNGIGKDGLRPGMDDHFIYTAAALRQLKENGGTWSDVARALDGFTSRNSGSQGDKAFLFKKMGADIRKFAESQGIELPQGDLQRMVGEPTPAKALSPGTTTQSPTPPSGQMPVEIKGTDGKVYPAVVNGFYDMTAIGKGITPSVGRWDGKGWSHGMLRPGEEIVTPGVTPEAFEKFKASQPTTKPAEPPTKEPEPPSKAANSARTLRSEQPQDILDALESTGKINIASARAIREGYNPPPSARKFFDFKNQSSGIDKVLQGVSEQFPKLTSEDELLDAIDNAGPARQGLRRMAAKEAKQVQMELESGAPTSIGQQLEDWADAKIKDAQGRVSAGLDPELLTAYAIKGARIIQRGIEDFAHWSREMVQQFGESIKPHLADIFERSQAHHKSMGDVAYGEEQAGEGGGKYGIAARVREERAKAGQVVPVPPGKGVTAEETVEYGRMMLEHGADPEKILSQFENTGRLSASDMGVVRAQGEKLATDAEVIKAEKGKESPEYQAAFDALSSWDTRTKAMQTEWHRIGEAQQGETALDTGTFTGLQRAYKAATGKEFTPEQAAQADEHAAKVKTADEQARKAQDELFENIPKEKPDKPGAPEDPKSDANVWKKVRDYIEKGDDDYKEIVGKVATDLGMPYEDVVKAISRNKTTKRLADGVWRKQQTARRVKEQARRWFDNLRVPGWEKALRSLPGAFFGTKVGFGMHGFVGLGTHAPMLFYQPRWWGTYFPAFGKMYKMVFNTPYHEVLMQDLVHRPNFITARRAGLANDPFKYEEYANVNFNDAAERALTHYISPQVADLFNKFIGAGNRGYSVLKVLRQDMFDREWNKLPDSITKDPKIAPHMASELARDINHNTGVVNRQAPKYSNLVFFAPRLEMSRVAWLFGDPIRAAHIAANWKNATVAEKMFANRQWQQKAWVAGTMFAMLAANQAMLKATGSKQKINGLGKDFDGDFDPLRSDFLKFKVAGQNVAYGNAMVNMARLPLRLYVTRYKGGTGKMAKLIYPEESMSTEVEQYGRTQLSPIASFGSDIVFKGDYEKRPLPEMPLSGPMLPVPKRLAAQGIRPYTWKEFLAEQLSPIPVEEAQKPVWRHGLGMSDEQIKALEKALAAAAFMSATGSRVSEDTQAGKQ